MRPVPLVSIDFGNGHVVRRTLHGNVATYACDSQGFVLDILPGIYEPGVYLDRLRQLERLHDRVAAANDVRERASTLAVYHARQLGALDRETSEVRTESTSADAAATESKSSAISAPPRPVAAPSPPAVLADPDIRLVAAGDLLHRQALARDTELNESVRRRAIHQYLLECGRLLRPDDVVKWMYREVLHADLDDPYLGLGKALFEQYPFTAEDAGESLPAH